jgi:hypothetical protein
MFPLHPLLPSPRNVKIKVNVKVKNKRTAAPGGTNRPPDTTAPGTATGAKKTA